MVGTILMFCLCPGIITEGSFLCLDPPRAPTSCLTLMFWEVMFNERTPPMLTHGSQGQFSFSFLTSRPSLLVPSPEMYKYSYFRSYAQAGLTLISSYVRCGFSSFPRPMDLQRTFQLNEYSVFLLCLCKYYSQLSTAVNYIMFSFFLFLLKLKSML